MNPNTKPILFSGEMVLALLAGRKTQTRRIIKNQPMTDYGVEWFFASGGIAFCCGGIVLEVCPYAKRYGDLLWVRETTKVDYETTDTATLSKYCADNAPVLVTGCSDPKFNGSVDHWHYSRDIRPSIHMPRNLSRLTLMITRVRAERVADISDDDAIAEGITGTESSEWGNEQAIERFSDLWDSLNKSRGYGWDENPWVWVLEFEVIKQNVDDYIRGLNTTTNKGIKK